MKYYKIVNPNGHNGIVYKEGYNEDPLPFTPSGDCEPGGIYFSREDILAFLDYGTEVYEVEPVGEVYENPSKPKKYKAHAVNLKYIGELRDLEVIKKLIEDGADVNARDNYALRWASKNGHLDIVRYLIEHGANIHANNDCALLHAENNGYLDVVKFLKSKIKQEEEWMTLK